MGQVLEVVQALAQVGIQDLGHAGADVAVHLLYRRLGGEPALDRLADAREPAAVAGDHAIGFQDVAVLAAECQVLRFKQRIERSMHVGDGVAQPLVLAGGVIGHQPTHRHVGLMQDGHPHRVAGIQPQPLEPKRQQRVAVGGQELVAADEFAPGQQLGQHHGQRLQRLDFLVGVVPAGAVLHRQNAQDPAAAQDRHPHQRVVDLLTGLGAEGKVGVSLGIGQGQRPGAGGNIADQALAQAQSGLVNGRRLQALGGEQLEHVAGTADVNRTHLGHHVAGDDGGELVQPLLRGSGAGHDVAHARQQAA